MYRYLFGPVQSRRLGSSLGVDLVPCKTCSYDCVFCQVGRTSKLTVERREYVPIDSIMSELSSWIAGGGAADYVTLAGSGEPTLNSALGRLIDSIRKKCGYKIALLSNGSLFSLPDVRAAAAKADLVKVSLSAWDEKSFCRINHPQSNLSFGGMVDGLRTFSVEYQGDLWVEVFVVRGLNDNVAAMRKIAGLVAQIGPDAVHLNTVVRPAARAGVRAATPALMKKLSGVFSPMAQVIGQRVGSLRGTGSRGSKEMLGLVARHPCSLEEIADFTGKERREVREIVGGMVAGGILRAVRRGKTVHYTAVRKKPQMVKK